MWDERTEKAEIIELVGNEYRLLDDLFFFLVIESTCLFFYLSYNILTAILQRRYAFYDRTLNVCSLEYMYIWHFMIEPSMEYMYNNPMM